MSPSRLPGRPSLEYLKKLAKERLRDLRASDPAAKLADAQLAVAREHGFSSWRALKAEVDRRNADQAALFFEAAGSGDVAALSAHLDANPELAHARDPNGATALHLAVRHPEVVKLLLQHGADPNARDESDNALPLHYAAAGNLIDSARALLDAGSDPQGAGDDHDMDAIGWACVFGPAHREVIDLLVSRGAKHHVFSAIALNDVALLRQLVAEDPNALQRRLSKHEQEQTALHYVVAPGDGLVGGMFRTGEHYALLDALIELGADLEARDAKGRTPLMLAMLRGDEEAMRRLHAAGARLPEPSRDEARAVPPPAQLAKHVGRITPMLAVPDIDASVAWYRSLGFELTGSHGDDGRLDWAEVRFGEAAIMFASSGDAWRAQSAGVSLWIETSRIDELYARLKHAQLERARALLAGQPTDHPEVRFGGDLYTAFYGQREFSIRDPNGVELNFFQPLE